MTQLKKLVPGIRFPGLLINPIRLGLKPDLLQIPLVDQGPRLDGNVLPLSSGRNGEGWPLFLLRIPVSYHELYCVSQSRYISYIRIFVLDHILQTYLPLPIGHFTIVLFPSVVLKLDLVYPVFTYLRPLRTPILWLSLLFVTSLIARAVSISLPPL